MFAISPVAIVPSNIWSVVICPSSICFVKILFCAIFEPFTALSAIMLFSTALACIVAEPVTFPLPSKDADVQTTSPVIPIVLPVASAVAVSALPVTLPVILP